ncbi:hypothetical protein FSARC_3154 [Fusarium sarcochroum]|uniref:PD-(D/E)XK nuclease-like domain-containing protein n=1 Tax=Fusarium sarcochroum TaxID=1208366 RepID=A0A8H4U505_9HYPO|nr:hypothetical protein FSARC_3154 [Fusarium sarcochroum]
MDLLPLSLRQEVEQLGAFPKYAFYDPDTYSNEWRIPDISLVQRIVTRAAECSTDQESELSWNHHVHGRLLDWAFPDAKDGFLESRYCTSAQIIHEYKPQDAPSKSVDFCVCIKPPKSSTDANMIERSIKN